MAITSLEYMTESKPVGTASQQARECSSQHGLDPDDLGAEDREAPGRGLAQLVAGDEAFQVTDPPEAGQGGAADLELPPSPWLWAGRW